MKNRRRRNGSADDRTRREVETTAQPPMLSMAKLRKPADFEREAERVLGRLHEALAQVIDGLGAPIRRAVDLQRRLDVEAKLAWGIFRFARRSAVLAESANLPPNGSVRRVLAIALERGASSEHVAQAQSAVDELQAFIEQHAGDRETFSSMISSVDSDDLPAEAAAEAITVRNRKMVFRGMSHLLGVQVGVGLRCRILHPGITPGTVDSAAITGRFKWRRLRTGAMMHLGTFTVTNQIGGREVPQPHKVEPLDPVEDAGGGFGLLRQFCSHPLPKFVDHQLEEGTTVFTVAGEALGNSSVIDTVLGLVQRGLPTPLGTLHPSCEFTQELREPTELAIFDVLLPEAYFGKPQTSVVTFNKGVEGIGKPGFAAGELVPMPERVICLGKGVTALRAREVPRYGEMVEYACDRLGWDLSKMTVYRCRVRYPVPKWAIEMSLKFPAPGNTRP